MMEGDLKEGLNTFSMLKVSNIVFTTHLSFIDRFTRTIKNMLLERAQHTKKYWYLLLSNVIKQYKNTIQNSTKLKPVGAIQDKNTLEAKTNLMLRARFKRKSKEINVGDFCEIFKKKQKYSEMKEHIKHLTDATYEVMEIDRSGINGQVCYKLDGLTKLHLRNELLLVK